MLQAAGIPYYHEPRAGYRISRSFFLPPINLTVTEALGLMTLVKLVQAHRSRPLIWASLSAIYKLLNTVPEPLRSACGEMMAHVTVNGGAQLQGDGEGRYYTLLQQCIDERRACRLVYRSPVEPQPITCCLEPYALHFAARAWYVLGRSDAHNEVRIFKLARIQQLDPLNRFFRRPKRFRVEDKLGKAWQLIPEGKEHQVELEFSAKVAQNVAEVRWHPTQQQELLPDGRCRMTFTVDGLGEIAWWLCGYADQVVVKKPLELRRRVQQMLESAVANYQQA